jgi:peptide-methionine (S)-S-oxide reductase
VTCFDFIANIERRVTICIDTFGSGQSLGRALWAITIALVLTVPAVAQEPGSGLSSRTGIATFAGGCFWCMEPPFDKLDGVLSTTSGYTGGQLANPSYEQVSRGGTGHYEAVQVVYDPAVVTYRELLDVYWVNVDPLDAGGQFCDRGEQYLSAIFYQDDDQRNRAVQSMARARPISLSAAARIRPFST